MTSINEKNSRMAVCNDCNGKGDLISERLEEGQAGNDGAGERVGRDTRMTGGHVTLPLAKDTGFGGTVYDGARRVTRREVTAIPHSQGEGVRRSALGGFLRR